MKLRRSPRDQTVATKFSVEELEQVERMAVNERMTLSEYVRAATIGYMALSGNKLAWRLLGEGMMNALHQAATGFVQQHVRRVEPSVLPVDVNMGTAGRDRK